jgi:dihydrofolate synthase/folylpolyglutamate synthase
VLGILADKDAEGIIAALAEAFDSFVVTQSHSPRARSAARLATIVESVTGVTPEVVPDLEEAVAHACAHAGARGVVVTGSLYTVGEARSFLRV